MTDTAIYPISDWSDAYANASYIGDAQSYITLWESSASAFRAQMLELDRAQLDISYGSKARNKLDLFLPESTPKGLVVFVHGGYWMRFDKSSWSHFARGSLEAGYAVAMPSYTLCPEVSIADIVLEIGEAINCAAQKIDGEIRLCGHSAGGHLVTSMLCDDSPLPVQVQTRIAKTVSISGVHDLRALLNTGMNEQLHLNWSEAVALSPALKAPAHLAPLTCWVGADERPEFRRLNALQANIWKSFEISTEAVEEGGRHHFDIINGLQELQHPLMQSLLE
ncbi:MAG: hypothetical protein OFPI_17170 [Osedax symbiont Rs2]|nr:MAG: hypothetical protein OFPI_17170 [Osedax symbiont Rs2]